EREVPHEVEQPALVAGAAEQDLERDAARLVLALDALPVEEAAPVGGERADLGVGAVRRDEERVEREELRDAVLRVLVAREVVVERLADVHSVALELDDDEREAVHEED